MAFCILCNSECQKWNKCYRHEAMPEVDEEYVDFAKVLCNKETRWNFFVKIRENDILIDRSKENKNVQSDNSGNENL